MGCRRFVGRPRAFPDGHHMPHTPTHWRRTSRIAAVLPLVHWLACQSSQTPRDDGGRDDMLADAALADGAAVRATGGTTGGTGGVTGGGGEPGTDGRSATGGAPGTGGTSTSGLDARLATGGAPGTGGTSTSRLDARLATDGELASDGRDAPATEAGTDQASGVDVGGETPASDTPASEAAARDFGGIDGPQGDRSDGARIDGAFDPGVNMSDCPNPNWMLDLITSNEPPACIQRYTYHDQVVFYTPIPGCCDRTSTLYDRCGTILCAPDGGYTGKGDGRCPDFKLSGDPFTNCIWPLK
jgi:hypothetical protein